MEVKREKLAEPLRQNPLQISKDVNKETLDLEARDSIDKPKYGMSSGADGPRICPVLPHLRGFDYSQGSDDDSLTADILGRQLAIQADDAIKSRSCSWQKVSAAPVLLGRASSSPVSNALSLASSRLGMSTRAADPISIGLGRRQK